MKIIAITMLRLFDSTRDEFRDAIDQRWHLFLARCGVLPLYLPNHPDTARQLLEHIRPDGVLLTGGGSCTALSGIVDERDNTERLLLKWSLQQRLPLLGICRGMQVMLSGTGALLERVAGHIGPHAIRYQGSVRQVNSFHEYGFRSVPPGFEILGISEDGVIEAVINRQAKRAGIMWHPERNIQVEEADISLVRHIYGVSG